MFVWESFRNYSSMMRRLPGRQWPRLHFIPHSPHHTTVHTYLWSFSASGNGNACTMHIRYSKHPSIRTSDVNVLYLCVCKWKEEKYSFPIFGVCFFLARKLGVVVVSHTHTHIVHARTISTLCLCLPLACSISLTCPVPTSSEMSPTKFAIPKIYSRASFTEGSDG